MKNFIKEIQLFKELAPFIRYDAEQGRVYWAAKPSHNARVKIGDELGWLDDKHYRRFQFRGFSLRTHRLIFWLEVGGLPEIIDHEISALNEHGELDNRFSNLRAASNRLNSTNRRTPNRNNALGVRGVTRVKNRYQARIRKDGKLLQLGSFATIEEAARAHRQADFDLNGVFAGAAQR